MAIVDIDSVLYIDPYMWTKQDVMKYIRERPSSMHGILGWWFLITSEKRHGVPTGFTTIHRRKEERHIAKHNRLLGN